MDSSSYSLPSSHFNPEISYKGTPYSGQISSIQGSEGPVRRSVASSQAIFSPLLEVGVALLDSGAASLLDSGAASLLELGGNTPYRRTIMLEENGLSTLLLELDSTFLELFASWFDLVSLLLEGCASLEVGPTELGSVEEELSADVVIGAVLDESSPQLAQKTLVRTRASFFQFL